MRDSYKSRDQFRVTMARKSHDPRNRRLVFSDQFGATLADLTEKINALRGEGYWIHRQIWYFSRQKSFRMFADGSLCIFKQFHKQQAGWSFFYFRSDFQAQRHLYR